MYITYIYVYVWFFWCLTKIVDDTCISYTCTCNYVALVSIPDPCPAGGPSSRPGVRNWPVRTCVLRRKSRPSTPRRPRYWSVISLHPTAWSNRKSSRTSRKWGPSPMFMKAWWVLQFIAVVLWMLGDQHFFYVITFRAKLYGALEWSTYSLFLVHAVSFILHTESLSVAGRVCSGYELSFLSKMMVIADIFEFQFLSLLHNFVQTLPKDCP